MQLAYAMTALAAEVTPDGKLWMLGGDFDTLTAQSFPVTHPAMALVVKLWAQLPECEREHQLTVELIDSDGREQIKRIEMPFRVAQPAPGRRIGANLVLHLVGLQFPKPDDYAFHILVDDIEIGSVPLTVAQQTSP
ncbi:MAG TPA: hypothetical protein VK457_17370 [Chloroflexota bacterium]|jgi:hypothetical protein|nr:hypothetical protein [Chloroflexota bacterium]